MSTSWDIERRYFERITITFKDEELGALLNWLAEKGYQVIFEKSLTNGKFQIVAERETAGH